MQRMGLGGLGRRSGCFVLWLGHLQLGAGSPARPTDCPQFMMYASWQGERAEGLETRAPDCQHPHLCATIWFISNRITFVHTGAHTQGHLVVFIGWLLLLMLSPLTHGWHPQSMRLFGHLPPWGLSLPQSPVPDLFVRERTFFRHSHSIWIPANTRTHICHYSLCSLRSHLARQYGFGRPCGLAQVSTPPPSHVRDQDRGLAETHNQVLILNVYGYFIAAIRVIRPRSGSCRICYCSLLSGSLR